MLGIDLYKNNNIINMKCHNYILKLILYDINFYVKSIGSFIILSVMWYKRLTKCYLLHTNPSEFRELGKTCQATCFPLSTLNHWSFAKHTSWSSKPRLPNFPRWDSWAKNEMLYHELELWALMRLYHHEFWTMGFGIIFVNMNSFGL